jgi:hypothetical protein
VVRHDPQQCRLVNPNQFANPTIVWHQIVRDKGEARLTERSVVLIADLHQAVYEFAEFCVSSGGDRYTSVNTAMNEINSQSRELLDAVYQAECEHEVETYGLLLDCAISLFKALKSYYFYHFSPLRNGTLGDYANGA